MAELIKDIEAISEIAARLEFPHWFGVVSQIRDKGNLYIGAICDAETVKCTKELDYPHRKVFFRTVPKWTDVYSYKERTVSLALSVYALLVKLDVSLVITKPQDEVFFSMIALPWFSTESDLGIGYLRRASRSGSKEVEGYGSPFLAPSNKICDLWAEPVASIIQEKIEHRNVTEFDPRQDSLF
jgi:hypothetical protein